jgi:hypothetical protein
VRPKILVGSHEMAVISDRIWSWLRLLATSRPLGANHGDFDRGTALCSGKEGAQEQGLV